MGVVGWGKVLPPWKSRSKEGDGLKYRLRSQSESVVTIAKCETRHRVEDRKRSRMCIIPTCGVNFVNV